MTKYTTEEFADQIRCKYPNAYDDLDDETLIQLWLKKFPNDEEKIILELYEEESGTPKKSNKWKYLWAILLLILFVLFRILITSGVLKDSYFIDKNELIYDNDKVELKYGVVSNSSFDELYLFENEPVLESNGEPSYDGNISNNGIYIELCNWTKNTESLNIENDDLLNDLPIGHYTFKDKNLGNWKSFTITDMGFSTPKFSSDSSTIEIISGTMDISKNKQEYAIDFQFDLNNGKKLSGFFEGPLSKIN
jgi:hypothetical protein